MDNGCAANSPNWRHSIENNEIVYEKKKGASQSASGSHVPSDLNESPFFEPTIPQVEAESNRNMPRASVEVPGNQQTPNTLAFPLKGKVQSVPPLIRQPFGLPPSPPREKASLLPAFGMT